MAVQPGLVAAQFIAGHFLRCELRLFVVAVMLNIFAHWILAAVLFVTTNGSPTSNGSLLRRYRDSATPPTDWGSLVEYLPRLLHSGIESLQRLTHDDKIELLTFESEVMERIHSPEMTKDKIILHGLPSGLTPDRLPERHAVALNGFWSEPLWTPQKVKSPLDAFDRFALPMTGSEVLDAYTRIDLDTAVALLYEEFQLSPISSPWSRVALMRLSEDLAPYEPKGSRKSVLEAFRRPRWWFGRSQPTPKIPSSPQACWVVQDAFGPSSDSIFIAVKDRIAWRGQLELLGDNPAIEYACQMAAATILDSNVAFPLCNEETSELDDAPLHHWSLGT